MLCDRVEGEGSSDLAACYREGEKPFLCTILIKLLKGEYVQVKSLHKFNISGIRKNSKKILNVLNFFPEWINYDSVVSVLL